MHRDEAKKQFIKLLNSAGRSSRTTGEAFRDFCELAYCAFAQRTIGVPKEAAEALEERYMRIVRTYPERELNTIRETYPEMLAIAQLAVIDGGTDFLGEVAGQLEILDKRQEQFFTPYSVAKMMARMNLEGLQPVIEQDRYFTLAEPACGSGVMVLAAADVVQELGFNPCINMLVHAVDLSPMAYYMAYLQLTWRGIPAQVFRANTLSLETFESAWTLGATMFHDYHGHLSFKKHEVVASTPEPQPVAQLPAAEPKRESEPALVQLSLF